MILTVYLRCPRNNDLNEATHKITKIKGVYYRLVEWRGQFHQFNPPNRRWKMKFYFEPLPWMSIVFTDGTWYRGQIKTGPTLFQNEAGEATADFVMANCEEFHFRQWFRRLVRNGRKKAPIRK